MSDSTVHLALPGLLSSCASPDALPDNAAPLWCRVFAAASKCNQLSRDAGLDVAGLSYLADYGELPARPCWRCDPVYLQSDLSRVFLFDTVQSELDNDEAGQLVQAFNAHFADEGLALSFSHPGRWYLFGLPPVESSPCSTTTLVGRDIRAFLPGDSRLARLLTEAQMLFHSQPLNAQRESVGKLPVNGVWIFGRGRLPDRTAVPWARIYSESPSDRGLAQYADVPVASPPAHPDAIDLSNVNGAVLIRDESLLRAGIEGNRRWLDALENLEARWLRPLWLDLKAGRYGSLVIDDDDGLQFRVERRKARSLWRWIVNRDRPLSEWVNGTKS